MTGPFLNRLALYLWRDRGQYDPATGGMTQDYNVSLLGRYRYWRYVNRVAHRTAVLRLVGGVLVTAIGGSIVALVVHYLD